MLIRKTTTQAAHIYTAMNTENEEDRCKCKNIQVEEYVYMSGDSPFRHFEIDRAMYHMFI